MRPPGDPSPSALKRPWPWELIEIDEIDSTNAEAVRMISAGRGDDDWCLQTQLQTAGRGRLGRTWEAPKGSSLMATFVAGAYRVGAVRSARWPWLPLLTGMAVAQAVSTTTELTARLKWPNDVLIDGQKVAGILAERVMGPSGPCGILGMGINVTQTREQLPVDTATSLHLHGADIAPAQLLHEIGFVLSNLIEQWRSPEGPGALHEAYRAACDTIGRQVRVDLPGGGAAYGEATNVAVDGRLVLSSERGDRVLGAGDVIHVRPV